MALTFQQFQQLRNKGLSARQIADFEKREPPKKQGIFEKITRTLLPKSVEGFAETLGGAAATQLPSVKAAQQSQVGLDEMSQKLGEAIVAGKREGKDTSRMEKLYEQNTGQRLELRDIIGETADKSTKQIAGEALSTVGTMALGAKGASTVAKRLAFGAGIGSTFGAAEGMIKDEDAFNVVTSGIVGGLTGLAISGAFEGVGALAKKVTPKIGKHTFTKELQPPTKELTRQVDMGWQTFGEKVRSIKDVSGKGVYRGGYQTMRKQAIGQLKQQGDELMGLAKQYDPQVNINRGKIAGSIIDDLQNTFGQLTNSQKKAIQFEISRMPSSMNVTEMITNKRMYDGIIPDSFWLKAGDANVGFASQVKYILRDNLRKAINGSTDATMGKINNELSIAMDVKHLASEQIAKRLKQKISGSGGFWYKMVGRFIDDYLFNPAITTRVSHATHGAGSKVGQTPLRSATRNIITKESVK